MKQTVRYCGSTAGIVQIGSPRLIGPDDRIVVEGEHGVDEHVIAYLLGRADFEAVTEQPNATAPSGEEG